MLPNNDGQASASASHGNSRTVSERVLERRHLQRLSTVFAKHPLYFVTCCTAERRRILTDGAAAQILIDALGASATFHGWAVGRYVLMPDHVHFFARPQSGAKTLAAFMRDWKKWSTKQLTDNFALNPPIWQREFFDHVLRSADSYAEKWEYVRQNPVRAGLVATPDDWPHAGECAVLTF